MIQLRKEYLLLVQIAFLVFFTVIALLFLGCHLPFFQRFCQEIQAGNLPKDKMQHFNLARIIFLGFFLPLDLLQTIWSFFTRRRLLQKAFQAGIFALLLSAIGCVVVFILGGIKEGYDALGFGEVSMADFIANIHGLVFAIIISLGVLAGHWTFWLSSRYGLFKQKHVRPKLTPPGFPVKKSSRRGTINDR